MYSRKITDFVKEIVLNKHYINKMMMKKYYLSNQVLINKHLNYLIIVIIYGLQLGTNPPHSQSRKKAKNRDQLLKDS